MGKNREPVKPVESDSGQEDDDEGSEFETDSEPEIQPTQTPTPKAPSEEEEETGSETESESDSESEKPAVKPLALVQKSSTGGERTRSKSAVASPAKRQPVSLKRPAEDEDTAALSKNAKKKKVVEAAAEATVEKKPNSVLFQRLWSEEDAIGILEGMIEYSNEKKIDPMTDLNAFHDYLKKSLDVDFEFSKTQLQTKIKRLKSKYTNNKRKDKAGKVKNFSNPHEQKAYDLSKRIWGSGSETKSEMISTKSVDATGVGRDATALLRKNLDASFSKEEMLGLEGNEEWNTLRMEHLELYKMQLEINLRQTKLVMDAMKQL